MAEEYFCRPQSVCWRQWLENTDKGDQAQQHFQNTILNIIHTWPMLIKTSENLQMLSSVSLNCLKCQNVHKSYQVAVIYQSWVVIHDISCDICHWHFFVFIFLCLYLFPCHVNVNVKFNKNSNFSKFVKMIKVVKKYQKLSTLSEWVSDKVIYWAILENWKNNL